ncbi:MAG: hypothetical protein GXP05_01930 [Alphaproteobacteria bacterium]|nr:hypothetical protein [Alphaproteobacteria bacterium]
MRYYVGIIVSLAFIGGGLSIMSHGLGRENAVDDLVIGALMALFGVLIYIGAKRARNQPSGADTVKTPAKISATAVGMRLADDFDDNIGDDGDSGNDGAE